MGKFIITIDTEGDNIWNGPRETTTRNATYLPRFQDLCERHGLKPTYLVNHEMAVSPAFVEFGRDVLARGQGEIGMHLHAWDSPPSVPLTEDDHKYKPYLVEYPVEVMRAKIDYMTKLLQDVFDTPITSHRAGRWAMNETYAGILIEQGYLVDCSVTPHVDWRGTPGNPAGDGGTNYQGYPGAPYFVDPADLSRPGQSPLLEVPMSVSKHLPLALRDLFDGYLQQGGLPVRLLNRMLKNHWLRPNGRNGADMVDLVRSEAAAGAAHVEFMLHSSEFMPGGSPTFRDAAAIERLYADIDAVFAEGAALFEGATLAEFRSGFATAVQPVPDPIEAMASGGNVVIDGLRS